jgi:ABC-type multidrug transport system fused ATPase/permease subunit
MASFGRLLARVKNYKVNITLSIVSNIMLSIFTVVSIPIIVPFFQILFDRTPPVMELPPDPKISDHLDYYFSRLIESHDKETALIFVCLAMITVFLLKNIFRYLALFFMAPTRNGILRDIRSDLFNKYLNLPLSFYNEERKGDLLSRLTLDVQEIENSILNVIEVIFKSPLIMIGCIAYMIWESPTMTIFVFVLIFFVAVIIGGISKTLKRSSSTVQDLLGKLNIIAEESLTGMRIIKGFSAEDFTKSKYKKYNEEHREVLTRLLWRRDMSGPLSEFLGIATVTILLWYGSQQVFSGALSAESFFAFIFAFFQVIEPSKSFSKAYYNIQKGLAAVERVDQLLAIDNPIKNSQQAMKVDSFDHEILFDKVSFAYKGTNSQALTSIDLSIKKGEVVALVGASGAGKSTIADLLPRFYDVTDGVLSIDGRDIRKINVQSLRDLFGIVSQEAILFNDSLRNNITFGGQYSEAEIWEAVNIANAAEFIEDLEEGLETIIGDRGSKLSGGQRQRITIARAVLRNPPILILDEATSALDAESEKLVQKALEEIIVGRTTIIIAHRLSTIRAADKIIVMDKGSIVEEGSHESLMNLKGTYAQFVNMQTFA